ncbi:hypothetical protein J4471_00230 [Candidatus Woesearchaeota archaeon]|nr:hypothetical protein [Candidatus Woesearchaeota archaeon]
MKLYHNEEYLRHELQTKSYKELAKELNVDPSTIIRRKRKFGLTKPHVCWKKWEIELLKKHYSVNLIVYKLFPKRTVKSINHKASRLRLKRDVTCRKYKLNEGFFKIWSHEMAYVLGWFFSDGTVSTNKHSCSIHLHKKDSYILEEIKNLLDYGGPISFYKDSVMLRVESKMLHRDLINLGCKPRKSFNDYPFPKIPKEYLASFIRGFFDGDGSIMFNYPNTIKIAFVGNISFISGLEKELNKKLGLRINKRRKQYYNLYICLYYGDDARKLCIWMYENAGKLLLKRKHDRFINHLSKRCIDGLQASNYSSL